MFLSVQLLWPSHRSRVSSDRSTSLDLRIRNAILSRRSEAGGQALSAADVMVGGRGICDHGVIVPRADLPQSEHRRAVSLQTEEDARRERVNWSSAIVRGRSIGQNLRSGYSRNNRAFTAAASFGDAKDCRSLSTALMFAEFPLSRDDRRTQTGFSRTAGGPIATVHFIAFEAVFMASSRRVT